MNKQLPMDYGIEALSVESLVGIAVNSLLEKDKDRLLKAIAEEAVTRVLVADTENKLVQAVQQRIEDYDPNKMSEDLKAYIWDALKYEIERSELAQE